MKIFAIGDIHGHFLTLQALLKKLEITDDDLLIICGDIVDRGPRIKALLDFLLERPNILLIYGNHCWSWVDYHSSYQGQLRNKFMWDQGLRDTVHQLGDESEAYANRFKEKAFPYVKDENGKYIFCHADYNWRPDEQFDAGYHFWVRMNESTHGDYTGPIIVHGHTRRHPRICTHTIKTKNLLV